MGLVEVGREAGEKVLPLWTAPMGQTAPAVVFHRGCRQRQERRCATVDSFCDTYTPRRCRDAVMLSGAAIFDSSWDILLRWPQGGAGRSSLPLL